MTLDVTEAEEIARLRQSEWLHREMVENVNSVVLLWGTDLRIQYINPYGARLFGYRVSELLGKSVLEDASVVGAVKAGAIGYLLKDTDSDELCRAIRAAAAGQVQLSPAAAARLMREVRAPQSLEPLTDRETEVLRLLAEGKSNKEIAASLSISDNTVKTHVGNVFTKLDVQSRTQAALYAAQVGLASHPPGQWR